MDKCLALLRADQHAVLKRASFWHVRLEQFAHQRLWSVLHDIYPFAAKVAINRGNKQQSLLLGADT